MVLFVFLYIFIRFCLSLYVFIRLYMILFVFVSFFTSGHRVMQMGKGLGGQSLSHLHHTGPLEIHCTIMCASSARRFLNLVCLIWTDRKYVFTGFIRFYIFSFVFICFKCIYMSLFVRSFYNFLHVLLGLYKSL